MEKSFTGIGFLFLLIVGFAAACDTGCNNGVDSTCYNYSDTYDRVVASTTISYYCNIDTDNFTVRQSSGFCLNDFECVSGYSCVSGTCTGSFSDVIMANTLLQSFVFGLCPIDENSGYFCSNVTVLNNATNYSDLSCGEDFFAKCYSCNEGLYYDKDLGLCITGICDSKPGCSNVSINNTEVTGEYCSDSKLCYACGADFGWDLSLSKCVMKKCVSSPGCLNVTNLTDAYVVENRICDAGKTCFSCGGSRKWNSTISECVLSSTTTNGGGSWDTISFSDLELKTGVYKIFSAWDRVFFNFAGRSYQFKLTSVETNRIIYDIYPSTTMLNQNLYTFQERKYDLDSDNVYDFKVSLADISSRRANISLKFINEPYSTGVVDNNYVADTPILDVETQVNLDTVDNSDESVVSESFVTKYMWTLIVIGVVFIALLIGLIFYMISRKNDTPLHGVDHPASAGNPIAPNQPRPPVMPGNAPVVAPIKGYGPLPPRPFASQNPQFRQN